MKIYLDIILFLNFSYDFILLLGVSIILRRNVKLRKICLGALIGSLSIFILFIKINSFNLFILKIIISIAMILISFSYKNFKYTFRNFFYLYTESMVLGGFLYFLNVQFSYKQEGLIFYHNGLSVNFVFLIILSPIIIYTYVKQALYLKNNYANYYKIDIYIKDRVLKLNGFLDTGNRLVDPITKKPVIVISKKSFKGELKDFFLVPINTISDSYLLKCIKVDKIDIKGVGVRDNVLLGITDKNIKMEGVDCIIQPMLMEGT